MSDHTRIAIQYYSPLGQCFWHAVTVGCHDNDLYTENSRNQTQINGVCDDYRPSGHSCTVECNKMTIALAYLLILSTIECDMAYAPPHPHPRGIGR